MAEITAIGWTRSTFNAWIGCTEVSTEATGGGGCDGCYARELDKRHRWGGATHWGTGVPRHRTKTWNQPLLWNKKAPDSEWAGRKGFWPVFCSSLSDFADNEVPPEWQEALVGLIDMTPNLSWLLVTKRIGNVPKLYPRWMEHGFPPNVRIIMSVVNQREADRDVPKLLALDCKNGISYEPALGPVDWSPWLGKMCDAGSVPGPHGIGGKMCSYCQGRRIDGCDGIEWVIVGGESRQGRRKARAFDTRWARSTAEQCRAAGVPVFVKQMGDFPFGPDRNGEIIPIHFAAHSGTNPAEWPLDLRVQQWPE